MKTAFKLLPFYFFLFNTALAQNVNQETSKVGKVETDYDRNAISVVVLDNNRTYANDLKNGSAGIIIPGKFDDNMLGTRFIPSTSNAKKIEQALINNNVPNEIVAKWFSRDTETGKLDMSVVHERGMYNATDDEVRMASGSKIGLARLKDAGELLLNHSYILVLEFKDIEDVEKDYDKQDKKLKALAEASGTEFQPVKRRKNGWTADTKAYLYRLNFNDSIMNLIYSDLWIYDDDTPEVAAAKKEKFNQIKLPVSYILSFDAQADGSQYNEGEFLAPPKQLTRDELFSKLINTGMNNVFYDIERKVEEFRVKTPLYGTDPLRAKIGKKEGVKTEQRYFVYEFEQKRNGKTKANRKGVVRAKKVVDNRQVASGSSQLYTSFYQTAGFGLMEGMMLQQRNDFGLGVSANYSLAGAMGGFHVKVEANLGVMGARFLNADFGVNQVKLYASGGGDFGEYDLSGSGIGTSTSEYDMSFTRFTVGLSKGWYFANNFSVNAFMGYAMESATNDDLIEENDWEDGENIGSDFVHWGAYATMNILHNLQLVGTLNMYNAVGPAYNKEREAFDEELKYNDIFEGRSGASIELGVRLEF